MTPSITDWLGAVAALLTMIAAIAALIIAWRAPRMAAEFAESLRVANEAENERVRLRMAIFTTLMKSRSQILHSDAVAAINLIEVAFPDDQRVRDARRSFIAATMESPAQPLRIVERYHDIIEKIAIAIGFGSMVSLYDIQSGYYPAGLGKIDEAAMADAEEKIHRRAVTQLKS